MPRYDRINKAVRRDLEGRDGASFDWLFRVLRLALSGCASGPFHLADWLNLPRKPPQSPDPSGKRAQTDQCADENQLSFHRELLYQVLRNANQFRNKEVGIAILFDDDGVPGPAIRFVESSASGVGCVSSKPREPSGEQEEYRDDDQANLHVRATPLVSEVIGASQSAKSRTGNPQRSISHWLLRSVMV